MVVRLSDAARRRHAQQRARADARGRTRGLSRHARSSPDSGPATAATCDASGIPLPRHGGRLQRRRFDHLFEEISVQIGRLAPRYALWLRLCVTRGLDAGAADPRGDRSRSAASTCLTRFLREHELDAFARRQSLTLAAQPSHATTRACVAPAEWASPDGEPRLSSQYVRGARCS